MEHAKQAKLLKRFEKLAAEVEREAAAGGYAYGYRFRQIKEVANGLAAEHEARAEYIKQRDKEEREKAQRQAELDAEQEQAQAGKTSSEGESAQAQDQSPA